MIIVLDKFQTCYLKLQGMTLTILLQATAT